MLKSNITSTWLVLKNYDNFCTYTESLVIFFFSFDWHSSICSKVLNDTEETSGRGIHVLVLNQSSGAVMARRLFDTYLPREDEALSSFLNLITDGRFVLLTVKVSISK